jgi:ribosome-associated protein
MDLRALSDVADFFIVCTASSSRQIDALRERLEDVLAEHGCPVIHTEGSTAAPRTAGPHAPLQWVLLDCGELVIHLLDPTARGFYRLEDLWADAPRLPLPVGTPRPSSDA